MHPEAFVFVDQIAGKIGPVDIIVEVGSRNINGSVRDLFPCRSYVGIDLEPGPGVDLVCDFRCYVPPEPVDVVVCCEVLEHDHEPRTLIEWARRMLKPGGHFVMTCAGEGREPHSAADGGTLHEGEHYRNVSASDLVDWMTKWAEVHIDVHRTDTRCWAVR